ncbi:ribonuclease HII [Leptolyngbya sp. FACHB-711]|uniref:ribonuclease HII n=1 Tax=unclassified Leptolyngbya TaxID=2650499 RepID=UPI0016876EF9|nr:ribonuclease HII [Leptolyngbya sp. FACHB-711]MBD1853529.1 ribonuclease HII [Cyanobacteria bacterium FACHB-502]MBD2027185.1 ribonuclease HII [Leptolyngbya sp. FACHB-711]
MTQVRMSANSLESSALQLNLLLPDLEAASALGLVAGVDEVGRGALFGPVVAAAVILPTDQLDRLSAAGVTDSKQLSAFQRQELAVQIRAVAIDCRIGIASVQEIDRLNILQATFLAMRRAVDRLSPQPDLCLIDGNHCVPQLVLPQQAIVKGDQRSLAIAAASIVAKVWRDTLILRLAAKYSGYDLASNKGYGTVKHRLALQQKGASRQHRRSFSPCAASNLSLEQL